ncbi:CRLF2 factor, partial [Nothoprocta ornata]|nr:CRLF2 factor [Nothoprocta ornata]
GRKDTNNITIVNFNNEQMRITWAARVLFPGENVSFSYTFNRGQLKVWKPCPTYLLHQGFNSGCQFKTEGSTLTISIMNSNGSKELFYKRLKSDFYIKPSRPENVTFLWKDDTVTVSCNKPKRGVICLRLELQYKSKFDKEWQSKISTCCSVGEQGFDPRKCYAFRVRLKRLAPQCNVVNYNSDWEAETFWMNGTSLDSCDEIKPQKNTIIFLSCILAVLLMIFLLLILLCKWQRLQKSVMPVIPDPKYVFADLFNDHSGNFEEWIDKIEHPRVQNKVEYEESECTIEEKSQQEDKNSDKVESKDIFSFSGAAENDRSKTSQNACLMPAFSATVSLAGFPILMNDDMYVML